MASGLSSQAEWKLHRDFPFIGSVSSCSHLSNNNKVATRKERNLLLSERFDSFIIGIEPIGLDIVHNVAQILKPARFVANIIGPCFYHACIWAQTHYKQGVIIEFGRYENNRKSEYTNALHYYHNDGLRFARMSYAEFCNKIAAQGKSGSKLVECQANRVYTVGELIELVHSDGSTWDGGDYNIELFNCQHFAARAVKELGGTRKSELCFHIISKVEIPGPILKELEKNENSNFTKIEKIPIFGPYMGLCAILGEKIGSLFDA